MHLIDLPCGRDRREANARKYSQAMTPRGGEAMNYNYK